MSRQYSRIPDNIRTRFPHLKPLNRTPTLASINGIGFRLHGRRDFDRETSTYIATRCLCLFFIPILAIDAFRVADAGQRSWYFFGKESLSSFARNWNFAFALIVVCGGLAVGWDAHLSSPGYKAAQEIKRAAALMQSGDAVHAAEIYQAQIGGPASDAARAGLQTSLESCLNSDKAQTVATALRIVSNLSARGVQPSPFIANAFDRGIQLVNKFQPTDPDGALDMLTAVTPLNATNSTINPLHIALLKQVIAANPANTNRVVELALIYESNQQLDESAQVLLPCKDKLGDTEGARILGQYLLGQGQNEDAYKLLFPYVQTRLEKLRTIEKSYTNSTAIAYHNTIQKLNDQRADSSWYAKYDAASKDEKEQMVDAYVQSEVGHDPVFQRAQADLKEANKIVPVTLDLGIVQLNRAQTFDDPDARKKELESAEKTFLAIQGFASGSDEYRMFLGQVYYWLGKSSDGKELFDQLLASNKRSYRMMLAVASTLHKVGDDEQARLLSEEAYAAATKDADRFEAASLRAHIQKDIDDEIFWLQKCDPTAIENQISLNNSHGEKALQNGDRDLAAQYLRKAVDGYATLAKSAVILNNYGLACLDLYDVTGDMRDHTHGLALLEEAVSLDSGNSVTLINIQSLLLTRGYMDVVGDAIHFNVIKTTPDRNMLGFLYSNEQERAGVYQRLQQDEYFKKGLNHLDKALLLSPKTVYLYITSAATRYTLRDVAGLRQLLQKFTTSAPDLTSSIRDTRDYYAGKHEAENIVQLKNESQRLESLLTVPEIKEHPLSLACVYTELNGIRLQLAQCGAPVEGAKVLEAANAAYAAHQDSCTMEGLIDAYFFKAHQELSDQNADYAAFARQTRRGLSSSLLIPALLERDNDLAHLIRQNTNVLHAIELVRDRGQRFPVFRSVSDWAIFVKSDPAEAQTIIHQIAANQCDQLIEQLNFQINPNASGIVLDQYWLHKMQRDEKGALELYQAALKNNVPLPSL